MKDVSNLKQFAYHIERMRLECDFKVKIMMKEGEFSWLKSFHDPSDMALIREANWDLLHFIDSDEYKRGQK